MRTFILPTMAAPTLLVLAILAFLLAAAPPAAATGLMGEPCTASTYENCSTSCCFEGTCARSELCFGRHVPGGIGAPCTASEVGQCASGCCFQGSCTETQICFGGQPVTMFVQVGKRVVTAPNLDANSSEVYPWTLSLVEPLDSTTYFTNRPYRLGGRVSNAEFLSTIEDTQIDPVNAALVGTLLNETAAVDNTTHTTSPHVVLVELADGKINSTDGSITYLARKLPQLKAASSTLMQGMAAANAPWDLDTNSTFVFDGPSLFIDDCPDLVVTCLEPVTGRLVNHFRFGRCWQWFPAKCVICDTKLRAMLKSQHEEVDYCNSRFPGYKGTLCVKERGYTPSGTAFFGPGDGMICPKDK